MLADKAALSVAIITKNEVSNIRGCLKSVSFADDIVIVDSGSTDGTLDIAREFGCRVFDEPWKGYGPQKDSAIRKCTHDWVLIIDADERMPEETRDAIIRAIGSDGDCSAYSFTRKNYFHGRWIKYCGGWPDRQLRLVLKSKGRYRFTVHEEWFTEGRIGYLNESIIHHSYADYSAMIRKMDEYSTLSAIELNKAGVGANALVPLMRGMGMFFKTYVLKFGFLYGLDGLVIALTKAGNSFFKYAKLIELNRKSM